MNSTSLAEQKTNNFYKSIREREQAEKKHLEKWRKEFKKDKMNNNYTYSTSLGQLPSSAITNGSLYTSGPVAATTVRSTSIADPKIHIDGGENGSMRVDVPLIVNGRDVMKELDEMRDAMLLLKRDVDMEAKYPKLKELKDAYECQLEKYKTFDAIKESK